MAGVSVGYGGKSEMKEEESGPEGVYLLVRLNTVSEGGKCKLQKG